MILAGKLSRHVPPVSTRLAGKRSKNALGTRNTINSEKDFGEIHHVGFLEIYFKKDVEVPQIIRSLKK